MDDTGGQDVFFVALQKKWKRGTLHCIRYNKWAMVQRDYLHCLSYGHRILLYQASDNPCLKNIYFTNIRISLKKMHPGAIFLVLKNK